MYLGGQRGPGKLVYMHESSILAVPFNLSRLATEGAPQTVLDGVASGNFRGADFSASNSGIIAFVTGKPERHNPTTISWLDRSGNISPLYSVPALYTNPRLSPDGKRIVFTVATASGSDIWVKDLDRDTPTRLTFLKSRPDWPFWTSDSRSILFSAPARTSGDLYSVDVDGSGSPELVAKGAHVAQGLGSFSMDGKTLVFSHGLLEGTTFGLGITTIEGERGHRKLGEIRPFLPASFDDRHPAISPDGKWIAYDSVEAGSVEVYVRPYPGPGGKWRVSNGGGLRPIWFRNSHELLYHNPSTARAMVVSYSVDGGEFKPGKPELWSDTPLKGDPVFQFYDLSPDGKRLAVVGISEELAPSKPPNAIGLLINWPAASTPRH